MKLFNSSFTIIFLLFAGLQYNDPDPWLWVPIYVYAALICYMASKKQYYPKATLVGIGVYLAYAIYLVFAKNGVVDWVKDHQAESIVQTMQAEKPWIEDTREFGGLLILIVVLFINYRVGRKHR